MNLDVLVNSCARPDIMEISLKSFFKRIKTKHDLRFVLLEDKVDDEERQKAGLEWINKNRHIFDEVHFAEKKMGPGRYFAPLVKFCQSDYFFHLEDDNQFIMNIDIDPLLDFLINNQDAVEIIFRRGLTDPRNHPANCVIDGIRLTRMDILSNSAGVFNSSHIKRIIDELGWNSHLNESKKLGPTAEKFGLKRYTLGFNKDKPNYVHLSKKRGYKKGEWVPNI
jgi:hypothetical protein